jgi:hypothetical protein
MHRYVAIAAMTFVAFVQSAAAAPFPAQPAYTVTTQESYKSYHFDIKPGQTIKGIAIPASNRPVHLMVSSYFTYAPLQIDHAGIGQATLLRRPGHPLIWVDMDWSFLEDDRCSGNPTTCGANNMPGGHVLYADDLGVIDVQVQDTNTLQVASASTSQGTYTVTLTFTY